MKSTFEKMGGTYTLGADGIYYPNLVSTDEEPHYGKYGMLRKTYLKEHRPAMYSLYMLEDRLVEHLNLVDDEAQERMEVLVHQMMERQAFAKNNNIPFSRLIPLLDFCAVSIAADIVPVEYPSTTEILADLHELEMEITKGLAELEEMV